MEMYLIWSNDVGAWWKPRNAGYTLSVSEAGRYTRPDALRKCAFGRDGWKSNGVTPEILVRAEDVQQVEDMVKNRKHLQST